jgi:phage tail tape-measure protein
VFTLEDLGKMSHADLVRFRDLYKSDDYMQGILAPYEHRAFAREWVKDTKGNAALSLPFAIPAYQAAKALGLGGADATPPSLEQAVEGFRGLGEGLSSLTMSDLVPGYGQDINEYRAARRERIRRQKGAQ